MSTADNPRAGQFTLGFYGWYRRASAAEYFANQPDTTRYFDPVGRHGVAGPGPDELVVDLRRRRRPGHPQRRRLECGLHQRLGILGPFKASEGTKIRVGTKFNFHSEVDHDFRIAGWLAAHIPDRRRPPSSRSRRADRRRQLAPRRLGVGRCGFEVVVHGHDFVHDVRRQEQTTYVRVPNLLRFGVGATIPVHAASSRSSPRPTTTCSTAATYPRTRLRQAQRRRPHLVRANSAGPFRRPSAPT